MVSATTGKPSEPRNIVVTSTAVIGSLSIAAVIAAIPIAMAGTTDDDRPPELGDGRCPGGGQIRDGQGEGAESGQRVQAGEDERPDAGRQQPGEEHRGSEQAADRGRLEQQEGTRERGPEQRAD